MRIVLLHYHLRTGGVTRVIESQAKALTALGHEVLIPQGIPELDYLTETTLNSSDLLGLIQQQIGAPADLWIIHNPTLGKNVLFPDLIATLAETRTSIILQCHDFAEDGRPSNYTRLRDCDCLYPVASHLHYAFINQRDQRLLIEAGIPADHCHYLPNAVPEKEIAHTPSADPLIFYPVRGIRRKNLGEFCLWARHAPEQARFAVACAPENPEWIEIHDHWQRFAEELHLPIEFDVADSPEAFDQWLGQATHIATTSIAEGFGLTFLESHLLQKPLIGRDLPEITRDFKSSGLSLGETYERIPIPLDLIDLERLEVDFHQSLTQTFAAYGRTIDPTPAWEQLIAQRSIDFGNLPEAHQQGIIKNHRLHDFADWLDRSLQVQPQTQDLTPWSLPHYQNRLVDLLDRVMACPFEKPTFLPKENVLAKFLTPDRFHFLRT